MNKPCVLCCSLNRYCTFVDEHADSIRFHLNTHQDDITAHIQTYLYFINNLFTYYFTFVVIKR